MEVRRPMTATSPSAPASPEELLRHRAWLDRLALGLVRDPAAADDLVQETLVAALERPPTGDPRPWFARVVRNRWLRGRRDAGRRSSREAALEPRGPEPSAEELAERAEMQRSVVAAVLALDEPYRDVVLRRYFGDTSSAEIARITGEPESTVRNRLRRALEHLRVRLDAEHGGDRRAWMLALARWAVPDAAPAAAAAIGAGTAVPLVVLALAALAAWAWIGDGASSGGDPAAGGEPTGAIVSAPPIDPVAPGPLDGPEPEREALAQSREPVDVDANTPGAPTAAGPSGPLLLVRVVDGEREPVIGAWVRWRSGDASGEATTDATGVARVARSAMGSPYARVRAGADGHYAAEKDLELADLAPSEPLEILVPFEASVHGLVVDGETRRPAARVAVGFDPPMRHGQDPIVWTETDAAGRFRIDGVPAFTRIGLRTLSPDYAPSVTLTRADASPIEIALERGEPVHLRVVDIESGAPIAGAALTDAGRGDPMPKSGPDGLLRARGLRVEGYPSIDLKVEAAGYGPVRLEYEPRSDPSAEPLELGMLRSSSVVGRVVDGEGRPVPGASVAVRDQMLHTEIQASYLRGHDSPRVELLDGVPGQWRYGSEGRNRFVRTDEDGRFRIDGVRPISPSPRVLVQAEGFVTGHQALAALGPPGGEVAVEVVLRRGSELTGTLVFNGEPGPGRVAWTCGGAQGGTQAGEDGAFVLDGVPAGRVALRGIPARYKYSPGLFTDAVELDFDPAEPPGPIALDVSLALATISGRVVDGAGVGIEGVHVGPRTRAAVLGMRFRTETDAEGAFELEVPANLGELSLLASHANATRFLEGVEPGREDVLIRFDRDGALRVRARRTDGTGAGELGVAWCRAGRGVYASAGTEGPDADGFSTVVLPGVSVDLALVDVRGPAAPRYLFGVRVPPDGELVIDEVLPDPVPFDVEMTTELEIDRSGRFDLLLLEEHVAEAAGGSVDPGELWWHFSHLDRRLRFDSRGNTSVVDAGPGAYRVICTREGLAVEPDRIELVAGDAGRTIELRLVER